MAALKVQEKLVRKLFKELNDSSAEKSPKEKLAKKLHSFVEELNGESLDDYSLSNETKGMITKVKKALESDKEIKLVSGITKTPKDSKSATTSAPPKSKYRKPSQEYLDKKKEEGERIWKVLHKYGPISIEEAAEKAKVSPSRIQSHINFRNRKKNPAYEIKKGKVYAL